MWPRGGFVVASTYFQFATTFPRFWVSTALVAMTERLTRRGRHVRCRRSASSAVVHPGVFHAQHLGVFVLQESGVHDFAEEQRVVPDLDALAQLALDIRDR